MKRLIALIALCLVVAGCAPATHTIATVEPLETNGEIKPPKTFGNARYVASVFNADNTVRFDTFFIQDREGACFITIIGEYSSHDYPVVAPTTDCKISDANDAEKQPTSK